MWYANINLLHQHGPRISYLKSIQTFDVHFESVHTQSLLFQYRIKIRLNWDVHVHKETFLYWQSRMVWFQPSSNGNWLKHLPQVQQVPAARLLVQMCRLTVASYAEWPSYRISGQLADRELDIQPKWQGSRELLKSTTKAYRPSRGRITPIVSTKGNSSSISCLWIKSHSGDCFGWLYSYESWAFTFFQPLLLCCVWRKWQGYERAAQLPYSKVLNVQNESISEKCVIKKIRNSQVTSHMETLAALKYLRHSPRPSSLDPCLSVLRWRTFCCVSSIVILCPKWEAYGEVSGAEVSSQVIVLGSAPWLGFLVGLRWMKVIPLTCVITQIIHFPQRRY